MRRTPSSPPRRGAAWFSALAGALLLAACGSGGPLASLAADAQYSRPGSPAALPDGRTLNLRCVGRGSPTVIFEAGFGANSQAWEKVQPAVARRTRTCAYDRAGYGFSPPGPLPRDGSAIARDLDQALKAAHEKGPYVVVAHSAGGLYARLFAARRLKDVQGLVFLDATTERDAPPGAEDGLGGLRERVRRCLTAVLKPTPEPPPPGCLAKNADAHARAVAQQPGAWRTQLSELDEIFHRTSEQVARTDDLLANLPAYVITASETVEASRNYLAFGQPSVWLAAQQVLAGKFHPGFQTTVLSSHLIMVERPEVVIDATLEMVQAAREGRAPAPSPPDERPYEAPEEPEHEAPRIP